MNHLIGYYCLFPWLSVFMREKRVNNTHWFLCECRPDWQIWRINVYRTNNLHCFLCEIRYVDKHLKGLYIKMLLFMREKGKEMTLVPLWVSTRLAFPYWVLAKSEDRSPSLSFLFFLWKCWQNLAKEVQATLPSQFLDQRKRTDLTRLGFPYWVLAKSEHRRQLFLVIFFSAFT